MKQCLLLFLLTACSSFGYQEPPHIKRADMLAARSSRAYKAKNQLIQTSSGGGMCNGINTVSCSFVGDQQIGIEEGRRLFVEGVESLCAAFNNDQEIRPFLRNYPFVQKNIDLMLSFKDPLTLQRSSNPYLCLIFCERDTIFYETYDHEKKEFIDYYQEPYEEAVRIVHAQREAELK